MESSRMNIRNRGIPDNRWQYDARFEFGRNEPAIPIVEIQPRDDRHFAGLRAAQMN